IGDAVMATFKNSVDALQFAMALELDAGPDIVRIRAGVHVGQVQVKEGDAFGIEVNLAARIGGKPEQGGIWLSDRVREDWLRHDPKRTLPWTKHDDVEVKGFKERFTLWSLPASRTQTPTPTKPVIPQSAFVNPQSKIAPSRLFRGRNIVPEFLVGRDKEFAALDAAWSGIGDWQSAIPASPPASASRITDHSSCAHIITIVAWGGIGKTSLVAHWAAKKLAKPNHSGIERYFDWSFYSQGTRREGDATGASHAASADLFLKEALEFFGDPTLAASNAGAWQKGERLAQVIGQHRTLLILDGIEPLQDAKTGELRDDGLRALLRGLAAHNHGLCLVTTRQHLPELVTWHQTTAPEWELARLTNEAGAALLTKLGVNGADPEKRDLSARVKGHALTLTLLGNYLRKAHHGDIRRVDRVDFQKADDHVEGGHAFRVIAAYERWFQESDSLSPTGGEGRGEGAVLGKTCLAILRMLGLFDRPATPDCLAALRDPPIAGLTDAIATLTEDDWNEAVTHLVELNLVEEQPWEPRRILGYSEEEARKATKAREQNIFVPLGKPQPFENLHWKIINRNSIDAHPLIREFFAKRLQDTSARSCKAAHSRLFEHLRASVPYWPEGLDGLQPLYQAVAHGCNASRYQQAFKEDYRGRIHRGDEYFSIYKLSASSSELAMLSSFFAHLWDKPIGSLSEECKAFILASAGLHLRLLGRLEEAMVPAEKAIEWLVERRKWDDAAVALTNFSDLLLTVGRLKDAVDCAKQAVNFGNRDGAPSIKIGSRAQLGDSLHQMGCLSEAEVVFLEAEAVQRNVQPNLPLLYSLAGFQYSDLLLATAENMISGHASPKLPEAFELLNDVLSRASQTLEWAQDHNQSTDVAMSWLTIGHTSMLRGYCLAVLAQPNQPPTARQESYRHLSEPQTIEVSEATNSPPPFEHAFFCLETALCIFRAVARPDFIVRALLTRASLYFRLMLLRSRNIPIGVGDSGKADNESFCSSANADLNEACDIAIRLQMRLFEIDCALIRTKLQLLVQPQHEGQKLLELAISHVSSVPHYHRVQEFLCFFGRTIVTNCQSPVSSLQDPPYA
ncbi:MAG: adenylate/guanylate cyclase domain-containing protein, partial [Chloroflexi bacterium]|nr:adenylate/guanylate cyclase domain-containing protein [Chloroflexota bacterium]